jgi:protein SHQ1
VTGSQFQLLAHPYFLRLTFPGPIEEGKESAKLDISTGQLSIKLVKTPPQFFKDLDLLTQLIEPSKPSKDLFQSLSKIQDLEPDSFPEIPVDFEWDLPQEWVKDSLLSQGYGFNNQYSGYSKHIQDLTLEILEINDLDHDSITERRAFRRWVENEKFDDDYVLSDLCHQEEWIHVMDFKPKMHHYLKQVQKDRTLADSLLEFTEQEKQTMLQLKNRTCKWRMEIDVSRFVRTSKICLFGFS